METSEILGRGLIVAVGIAAAVRFHLMANGSRRAPFWMKYVAYPVTASLGLAAAACALMPGDVALNAALWCVTGAFAWALIIDVTVWNAGGKVCDIMDRAEAAKSYKAMRRAVDPQVKAGKVAAEYLTPSTFDALHEIEDRR